MENYTYTREPNYHATAGDSTEQQNVEDHIYRYYDLPLPLRYRLVPAPQNEPTSSNRWSPATRNGSNSIHTEPTQRTDNAATRRWSYTSSFSDNAPAPPESAVPVYRPLPALAALHVEPADPPPSIFPFFPDYQAPPGQRPYSAPRQIQQAAFPALRGKLPAFRGPVSFQARPARPVFTSRTPTPPQQPISPQPPIPRPPPQPAPSPPSPPPTLPPPQPQPSLPAPPQPTYSQARNPQSAGSRKKRSSCPARPTGPTPKTEDRPCYYSVVTKGVSRSTQTE